MVDNVTADPGSGGAVFATDEVSSVHYPISKLAWGALDTVNIVESITSNPLPVALSSTDNAVLDAIAASVAGTLAVSGTVTANLSATDNAVLDAIAASVAGTLTVDGSGVTQPISASSLPLPTGASTAAKQPALGTAGTASTDVLTVQGIASMTALTVDGSGVTQPVSASSLPLPSGASTAANQSTANTALAAIQTAVEGTLTVDLGANNDVTLATLPDTVGGDLAAINAALAGTLTVGSHAVTNGGTFAVQEDGAALTALQLIDNIVMTEDAAHQTGDAGVMGLAVRNDVLATLADTDGDYAPIQVDEDGAVYVSEPNRVDSNNSSTSTLLSGATFTGTGTDVLRFRNISVGVFSDQNSAADGLKIQFSSDNSNWDHEEDFTVTGGISEHHTVPVMGRYFRVVYTNGGTGQTAFRLESILMVDDITGTVAPLDTTIEQGNQAVLTRSVLSAENPSNDYVNIGATNGGNLKVSIEENSADVTISDGGNSITVDATSLPLPTGAATAANQSTANTALSAIQTAVELIDNAISGSEMQVDVVSSALPSGASTAANQSTIIGHVDGIEGLLSTIDADTGTIAGAVSGTEMQVDIVSGTVTANLGATDNAVLDSIDTAVNGTLTVDGSGVTQPVSGTVTANLSTTDNTVLDSIDTNTTAATSFYRNIDANAEAAIKGSAGTLYWLHAMNMTASVAYLHLYDATTASVTPGTTTPTLTVPIPTQGDTNGAGFVLPLGANGQAFSTAITLVVTTTTDGSTGDPGTNGVFINAGYT